MGDWFAALTKKLLEVRWYTWLVVVFLIALFLVLTFAGKRTKWNSKRIAYAAMCIAIAFVLSCIRLYRMPQGGSITLLSMMPIILFALACGPVQGALVGAAYGFLQLIQDPYVIHPLQMLVDYPLGYAALALGGLVMFMPVKDRYKLPLAVLIGSIGRYIMVVLSGTVFFAEYAPEGQLPLIYSLGYNIGYLGPDAALCFLFAFIPGISRVVNILRTDA